MEYSKPKNRRINPEKRICTPYIENSTEISDGQKFLNVEQTKELWR